MTCLNPSEVRNIIDITECIFVNSVEKRFHNNVFIDILVVDIDIHTNLRLGNVVTQQEGWRQHIDSINSEHLQPHNNKG